LNYYLSVLKLGETNQERCSLIQTTFDLDSISVFHRNALIRPRVTPDLLLVFERIVIVRIDGTNGIVAKAHREIPPCRVAMADAIL
jgi:hypothetical protein